MTVDNINGRSEIWSETRSPEGTILRMDPSSYRTHQEGKLASAGSTVAEITPPKVSRLIQLRETLKALFRRNQNPTTS